LQHIFDCPGLRLSGFCGSPRPDELRNRHYRTVQTRCRWLTGSSRVKSLTPVRLSGSTGPGAPLSPWPLKEPFPLPSNNPHQRAPAGLPWASLAACARSSVHWGPSVFAGMIGGRARIPKGDRVAFAFLAFLAFVFPFGCLGFFERVGRKIAAPRPVKRRR
jgi:hypothetical protein